jgi:SAM-dependent methyltransferase
MDINNYDIVADLYDIYVPTTYDIDFFLNETRKTDGEVLELMSGTGRVSIPLLEAGVRLTCVDNSVKSTGILQEKLEQKGLKAEVHTMDICQLELPRRYSMIIIPFHSFAHIVSPTDQREALGWVYRHLLPGGTFISTLGNPTTRRRDVDGQLHLAYSYPFAENGKLLLWILEQFDPDDKRVVKAFEFFELYDAAGLLTSKRLMELHFRLTPKKVFENMLQDTGFLITRLYGDYAYHEFNAHSSDSLVWVLEKRQ